MRASGIAFVAADDAQASRDRMSSSRDGRGGENVRPGALHEPFDHGLMCHDERAGHPCSLAERADRDEMRRAQRFLRNGATALRTEHAEAVRVVDNEPRAVPFREFEQTRQRSDVAIHAEHGVRYDHLYVGV